MADSVSFKAYLKRDGQEVEVRRFAIDAGAAASFLYLRGKIQAVFPSLTNDTFVVYWQDQEGDYITMSTDEELLVALTSGIPQPFKIYVHIQPHEPTGSRSHPAYSAGEDNVHLGVTCDSCDGEVRGYRYKCTKCPDYDLCATCSAAGHHTEHPMIRIPYESLNTAENLLHPKLVHKLMKRQHKFHKLHGWNRLHERGNRGQESAGRCSFKRPPCPAAGMFNVSTLSDILNTLVVGEAASAPAQPGASTSAQATNAQTTNAQASNAQAFNTQASNAQTTDAEANKREAWRARARKQAAIQAALIRKSLGVEEEVAGNSRPDHSSNSPPQNAAPRADNSASIGIGEIISAFVDNFLDPIATQMIFDGQSRSGQPTPANTTTTAGGVSPSTSTAAPNTTSVPTPSNPTAAGSDTATPSAPATTAAIYPELPTPPSHGTSASPRQGSPAARRNSDDWTLLNRESPVRGETVAMEIEGETHPRDLTLTVGTAAASAPATNPQPVDAEKKRIDDCLEKLRAMGFDLGPDTQILRDMLAKENCDITSILDILLNNARK